MVMACFKICHHINFSYLRQKMGSKLREGLRDLPLEEIRAGNDQTMLKQDRKTHRDVDSAF